MFIDELAIRVNPSLQFGMVVLNKISPTLGLVHDLDSHLQTKEMLDNLDSGKIRVWGSCGSSR